MVSWWHRDVIAAGKLPLMLCFVAFVVTFVCTRVITRLIRDGRGPFRNQVTATGTHIHHAVPGLILLIVGAFTAIGGPAGSLGWRSFAGVLVGIGTSLVLDEFALILHLQDDYWSGEGQLSVQAVTLTAACLGLALVGFSPYGVQDVDGIELSLRLSATSVLLIDGVLAVLCALKGKYRSALFGLFLPPVAAAGALRLARPSSIWARHFYHGKRLQRATRRAAEFDRRWVPVQTEWDDFIGGRPSPSSQPPPGTSRRGVKRLPPRNRRRAGLPIQVAGLACQFSLCHVCTHRPSSTAVGREPQRRRCPRVLGTWNLADEPTLAPSSPSGSNWPAEGVGRTRQERPPTMRRHSTMGRRAQSS